MLQGILPNAKLPFCPKIIVLSIFEGPFYTGFTVELIISDSCRQIRWNISLVYKGLYAQSFSKSNMRPTYDMNVDASFRYFEIPQRLFQVLLIIAYTMW